MPLTNVNLAIEKVNKYRVSSIFQLLRGKPQQLQVVCVSYHQEISACERRR
jgi:hypothetical protein